MGQRKHLRLDSWRNVLLWATAASVATAYLSVVLAGFQAPLGYDESYNAQVALNLAHDGQYATDGSLYGDNLRAFDAFITTGPTLMIPAAAAVRIFGDSVWALRLAPTCGFLLAAFMSALWGRRLAGSWGMLAGLAGVLAVETSATWPSYAAYGPGDLVGETTCVGLLMVGAWHLHRTRLAGITIGLAVLTKLLSLLFLPTFVAGALLAAGSGGRRSRAAPAVHLVAWSLLPIGVWHGVRLAALGPSAYSVRNEEFLSLFVNAGSGLVAASPTPLVTRMHRFVDMTEEPWWTLLAIAAGLTALWFSRRRKRTTDEPRQPDTRGPVLALVGGAGTVLVWWFFVASEAWSRHALIPVFVLSVFGWIGIVRLCQLAARIGAARTILAAVTGAALATSMTARAIDGWHPAGVTRAEQEHVAGVIQRTDVEQMRFEGWWQNPELALLSGVTSRRLDGAGGLLVLDPVERALDSRTWESTAKKCGQVVYDRSGYLVCWVDTAGNR